MKNSKILLSFLFIFLYGTAISQEWKLEKDKNGIKIYARDVADSQFAETKSVSVFNTSKEKFLAFIWDVEDYPNWQDDYEVAKVVKDNGKFNKTIYFEFKAPWPISNRDVVISMNQVTKDDETYVYTKVKKFVVEPKDGIIRMSKYDGFWKLKQVENGVEVTLQMSTNPEGKIPDFLVGFHKVTGPFNAYMNMKKVFE